MPIKGNMSLGQSQNITFSVGVPNILMQLLDGKIIKRMLTLEAFDDFGKLNNDAQKSVIRKVATVALGTVFIALAVAVITVEVIYAIPLCLLATMALSFTFITSPEYASTHYMLKEVKNAVEKEKRERVYELPTPRVTRSQTLKNRIAI